MDTEVELCHNCKKSIDKTQFPRFRFGCQHSEGKYGIPCRWGVCAKCIKDNGDKGVPIANEHDVQDVHQYEDGTVRVRCHISLHPETYTKYTGDKCICCTWYP